MPGRGVQDAEETVQKRLEKKRRIWEGEVPADLGNAKQEGFPTSEWMAAHQI
ncbi:hypothetical protein [Salinibacter grassmerensis]|uniref:hypothetical protein n=1 Tax=Salinibacter grassmerensis TaxID=3040353 RepID=UPI0021E96F24|nr:hypothetical protein [Salinibacter grassmerensis]